MTTSAQNWYWSQAGATLGPVDLDEIRRLAANGSITRDTWLFEPGGGAWVAASSVAGLFAASVSAPPDATAASASNPASYSAPAPNPAPAVLYCRFCGAGNDSSAARCGSCGRECNQSVGLDPKVAIVICRASILAAPILFPSTVVIPFLVPGIVWMLGSGNPRIVAETKQTFNCLLTLLIALIGIWIFGLLGLVLILPAILAGIATFALAVYCVVVGIQALIAASNGVEYSYPWVFRLIK